MVQNALCCLHSLIPWQVWELAAVQSFGMWENSKAKTFQQKLIFSECHFQNKPNSWGEISLSFLLQISKWNAVIPYCFKVQIKLKEVTGRDNYIFEPINRMIKIHCIDTKVSQPISYSHRSSGILVVLVIASLPWQGAKTYMSRVNLFINEVNFLIVITYAFKLHWYLILQILDLIITHHLSQGCMVAGHRQEFLHWTFFLYHARLPFFSQGNGNTS